MKILIVSYFFPPYNSIGAIRVGKLAEYWAGKGFDVKVITAKDQPLPASLSSRLSETKVIRTSWFNVNRTAELMSGGREKVASQGYVSKRVLIGKFGKIYKSVFNFPDGQIGWFPFSASAGSKLITRGWKPDMIFASGTPFTSLIVGHYLAAKFNIPWVAELRDLWTDSSYYEFSGWRKRIESALEKKILSTAAALITVSEPLADVLCEKNKKPTASILNGFDPEDYPAVRTNMFDPDCLNLVYTGMVYKGKRDPSPLFEAIGLLPRNVKVAVHFYGRYLNEIHELAKHYGVENKVFISSTVSYKQSLQIQKDGDVLLLLLWNSAAEYGVYTGKIFEYIGAGHPILVIGSELGVAAALVRQRNAGFVSNNPKQIADQLAHWYEQKKKNNDGTLNLPESVGEGLRRSDQFAKLDEFLANLELLRQHEQVNA